MPDDFDAAREKSNRAINEHLKLLLAGDNSVNRSALDACVAALLEMSTEIGQAADRFESNSLEIRGVFVPGELSQLDQSRGELIDAIDLLADEISVAPDLYRRKDSVTFHLAQLCRTSALESLANITRDNLGKIRNSNEPLSNVLAGFTSVLSGFLLAEVDPAIRALQQLSSEDAQVDVSLGQHSHSRVIKIQAARVSEIEDIAERSLKNIRAASRGVGVGRLAKDFQTGRNAEKAGAKFWTTAVFFCVAAAVSLPILILSVDTQLLSQLSGTTGVVVKALTGIPLLGLAGYCARIASQHREAARHLAILTTQMDALRAYVDGLPDEDQREITMILGRRAFSNPALDTRDSGSVSALPEDAAKVLEKAMDLVKDALKRSS